MTSEFENLATIARFVARVADRMGLDAKTSYAVQVAVDEACTNVIEYAYGRQPGHPLTVECRKAGQECVVVIRDQGKPFDPSQVPQPDLCSPLWQRREGGLGLFLIQKLMDDVRFRFDALEGNELTLVKSIPTLEARRPRSDRRQRLRAKQGSPNGCLARGRGGGCNG